MSCLTQNFQSCTIGVLIIIDIIITIGVYKNLCPIAAEPCESKTSHAYQSFFFWAACVLCLFFVFCFCFFWYVLVFMACP
jgi:hypothetical protein